MTIKTPIRWIDMGAYAEIQDAEENVLATTRGIFNGVDYAQPAYWAKAIADVLNEHADLKAKVEAMEARMIVAESVFESLEPAINYKGVDVIWSSRDRDWTKTLIANYRALKEEGGE